MSAGERGHGDQPVSRVSRAFADTIARMHLRLGGSPRTGPLVREWAQRVWQAADEGHVCVAVDAAAERDDLAASPVIRAVVGDPAPARAIDPRAGGADNADDSDAVVESDSASTALVLDLGCLYLHRLHRAERRLARAMVGLDAPGPVDRAEAIDAILATLFPAADPSDAQRAAAFAALSRRLTLISGGPGTGKTTTLARLLVAFARLKPDARVCYAAPTGKAAARLAQSLAAQLPALDPNGDLAARLPASGLTVHRLLGLRGEPPGESSRPVVLAWDLVIVDEASMLDVELASALADAIPPHGRLVLAGDRDQLASVEAGAVFSELCSSGLGGIVTLDRNFRQLDAIGIVELAAAVRRGAPADEIIEAIAAHCVPDVDIGRVVDDALAAWAPALDAIAAMASNTDSSAPASASSISAATAASTSTATGLLAAFERYRVLAAMRDGDRGVLGLNRAIAARVRARMGVSTQVQWYPGRLVIVTRNQPDAGLVNGDVGVCLTSDTVSFAGAEGVRAVPVLAMPACEDAYAITVHKSQGSEFDAIAFVPAPAGHPLNSRELVYTAITRARSALRIHGDPRAIAQAAREPTARDGRLGDRIAARLRLA